MPEVATPLAAWESFYVILGSSAAALTGLMFVIIVLIADMGPRGATAQGIATFATPTIVHFSAVLLASAILSAPWHDLTGVTWCLGVSGIFGVIYASIVVRRAFRSRDYKPVFEDWVGYVILPFVAYAVIVIAALLLEHEPVTMLFVVGAGCILLIFAGIHNAWDTVTHLTLQRLEREKKEKAV